MPLSHLHGRSQAHINSGPVLFLTLSQHIRQAHNQSPKICQGKYHLILLLATPLHLVITDLMMQILYRVGSTTTDLTMVGDTLLI